MFFLDKAPQILMLLKSPFRLPTGKTMTCEDMLFENFYVMLATIFQ